MPMQVRHDVAERFDVHVIGTAHGDDCLHDAVQVGRVRGPLLARQLIEPRRMPRVEHEDAVAAIHLIVRQVPRRRTELRDLVPLRSRCPHAARRSCSPAPRPPRPTRSSAIALPHSRIAATLRAHLQAVKLGHVRYPDRMQRSVILELALLGVLALLFVATVQRAPRRTWTSRSRGSGRADRREQRDAAAGFGRSRLRPRRPRHARGVAARGRVHRAVAHRARGHGVHRRARDRRPVAAAISELALRRGRGSVLAVGASAAVHLPVLPARPAAADRRTCGSRVPLTACAFAAVHFPRWPVMLATLVAGSVWSLCYYRSRRLAATRGIACASRRGAALLGARPRPARRVAAALTRGCAGACAVV